MSKYVAGLAAIAMGLAACGSTAPRTRSTKTATEPSQGVTQHASAERLLRDTAAAQFERGTRVGVIRAVCIGSGQLTCTMTYAATAPNGQRHEIRMTVPVSCAAAASCTASWSTASTGQIVGSLGIDPRSPVAKCEKALKASIQAFTSQSAAYKAAIACEGVHHGVYTGRVQRIQLDQGAGAYPLPIQRKLLAGCAAEAPYSYPVSYCDCALRQTEAHLPSSNRDFTSAAYVLGKVLTTAAPIRRACS